MTQIDNLISIYYHKFENLPPYDILEWLPFVHTLYGDNVSYKKHPYILEIINDISNEEIELSIKLEDSSKFMENCLFFNAILIASCANDYEILISILNKGININTSTNDIKKTGLQHAVNLFFNNDNFPVIKLLIEHGADIHLPFYSGDNFFHTFVFNSVRISICKYLRMNSPFITIENFDTRIYNEYVKQRIDIFEIYDYILYILSKNGDYSVKNNYGYSAKYYLENTSLEKECLWSIRKSLLMLYKGCNNLGIAEEPLRDINYIKELFYIEK